MANLDAIPVARRPRTDARHPQHRMCDPLADETSRRKVTDLQQPLTIDAEADWSVRLRQSVAERAQREQAIQQQYRDDQRLERQAYQATYQQLVGAFDAEAESLNEQQQLAWDAAVARWAEELRQHDLQTRASIAEIEQRFESEQAAARSSREETTWLVASLLDESATDSPRQQLMRLHHQIDGTESVLQEAVRRADFLRTESANYLERCRMSTEVGVFEPEPPPNTLVALQERCLSEVQLVEQPYLKLQRLWLPKLFAGFNPVLVWIFLVVSLGGPAWWFLPPGILGVEGTRNDPAWLGIIFGSATAMAIVGLVLLHVLANQSVFRLITEVFVHSRAAQALFARWERLAAEELATAQQDLDQRHLRRRSQREESLSKAEVEYQHRMAELTSWRRTELSQIDRSSSTRKAQLEQARDVELARFSRSGELASSEGDSARREQLLLLEQTHQARLSEIEQEYQQSWQSLCHDWHKNLEELTLQANQWKAHIQDLCPTWDQVPVWAGHVTGQAIPIGHFHVELTQLDQGIPDSAELQLAQSTWQLPAVLNLTDQPGLMIQYRDPTSRKAAVDLLQVAMLRWLSVLPPGQVRFTILDPVSLGENFATFMHLADFDELLVTRRIWTEPGQIEERLSDLTEHMETVLQMFLRNEFATLEEYNQQAGEVSEPYRILVISGLPASFSDIALRKLWSIVAGGSRCGVIPLIGVDLQQPLPRGFDLQELASSMTVVSCDANAYRWQNPEMQRWPMVADQLPAPRAFGALIKQLGQLAGDVRKVEVPFQRVAPAQDAIWSLSAAKELTIPIGRAGATKTQSISLGVGTSQHVLIAGKTGSGKSTLLHALITNAALHYSPEELEFYLIDFKKGVEFKVYARYGLPHARVIGIESDREFGVSTLERLDWELQQRSAQFRDSGVADLAGYRRMRPDHPMPRILLVIDEFQEFFVEDDPLSQTASLLLDRLIRQGRAFGVHVILGSQTLAGAYSLARSTLGQVAVRIALQCSESDAHLILSEENTAARLLTRPGEAIYNDANGLTAGNRLFQVVWLDDVDKERYLAEIQNRSISPIRPGMPAPIVFEGNIPADIRKLPFVPAAQPANQTQAVTVWLGEAVSLRGAQRLDFTPSAGNHLLLVGAEELSAAGVITAAALSVVRQTAALLERCTILNGSPREEVSQLWQNVTEAAPLVELVDSTNLERVLNKFVEVIRQRDGVPGPRCWLCLFDLVRFRKLRRSDDDFGFGGFDKKAATPSDLLAEILRDGPAVGVHVWIWCDSMNTVTRWLSREMQQQLENRVAFPMSATDSSLLIDSPVASRLGINRAWLFRGERGTLDKFRPYAIPQAAAIKELLGTTAATT